MHAGRVVEHHLVALAEHAVAPLPVHADGQPLVEGMEVPEVAAEGQVGECDPELRGREEVRQILFVARLLDADLGRVPAFP
ncbi:hypothetical protein D3C72_1827270 [compost metagenome]